MFITPQLIKDQEFQSKFRGFDPIEVKDYLEIIANEFFELQEQCKEHLDELESLREDQKSSESITTTLRTDLESAQKTSEELEEKYELKKNDFDELTEKVDELKLRINELEKEKEEHDKEVSTVLASIEEAEEATKAVESEKERLQNKIDTLLEQNSALQKDEVDFKSTLTAAQLFAEDLREKSKVEADKMIVDAKDEIEKIREDAHEELERLPREISELKKKKDEVKADLISTLKGYLDSIDVVSSDSEDSHPVESSELFQKIELDENGALKAATDDTLTDSGNEISSELHVVEKAIDSLFSDDLQENTEADDVAMEGMFNLPTDEEQRKLGTG